ncbi:MAG: hypothetical protein DRN91_04285, partial [Candidatus Alkanophagales archaeon]
RNKERQTVKCMKCGLEAHRDAVGCINIRLAQGERLPAGVINRAVRMSEALSWTKQLSRRYRTETRTQGTCICIRRVGWRCCRRL